MRRGSERAVCDEQPGGAERLRWVAGVGLSSNRVSVVTKESNVGEMLVSMRPFRTDVAATDTSSQQSCSDATAAAKRASLAFVVAAAP
jgi:hypothetical protein